ncbi:SsrA-binding protein SmpB [Patescibacteria group bacterium]|nr:SsrA-binding protein SmpB [Patescibacteria group bacterium]
MPTLATNKKAYAEYEIMDKFEAGVVLTGAEVKSVKNGQINLKGSYVTFTKKNEAFLINAHIAAYKPANLGPTYNAFRRRKLLLNKKELISLQTKQKASAGLTILPFSVYNKGSLVKIQLALAKGRKKADKREKIKKRELDKHIRSKLRQKR